MVNVVDIKGEVIPEPEIGKRDMLDLIFERQHGLANKYIHIEEDNGLLQTSDLPVNIDSRNGQARLKDFAWRVTEELLEATDALTHHEDHTHFLEEMIDALHFFLELNLLCGIDSSKIRDYFSLPKDIDSFEALSYISNEVETLSKEEIKNKITDAQLIYVTILQPIGNAMNRLKNKPWKQTHIVTDYEAFLDCLMPAWLGFFRVLNHRYDLTPQDIFTLYFKKSEVNKFRIRSGY